MIAAYENILADYDTIAATNEDGNKPVTNIFSTYLSLLFGTTAGATVITITFTADQTANSFFLAYTDLDVASTVSVVYKNAAAGIIFTDNLATTGTGILKSYFTELTTIRSIEITITNNDAGVSFFIGSIWISESLTLPDASINPVHSLFNLAGYNKSTAGNVSGQVRNCLQGWETNIPVIGTDVIRDNINDYITAVNNLPHFIDFYEELDDWVFFCHLTAARYTYEKQNDQNRKYSNYKLTYEEAI